MNSRDVAGRILARWFDSGAFPDRDLDRVAKDHAFIQEVVLGVVRWYGPLDWTLRQLARHPPPTPLRVLCYVGFYQLFYLDQVEEFAAVHETVEAARHASDERGAGLVNALLRTAQRERERLHAELQRQPEFVRLSHPVELLRRWRRQFGQRHMLQLCEWNNERPAVTLRLFTSRVSVEDYRARLSAAGIEAEPHPFAPGEFLVLPHGLRIPELPGYDEGLFQVQDPATASAVDLLDPRPGEAILDACAAPGGKTLALADRMGGRGLLVAADRHEDRLAVVRENLRRVGRPEVIVRPADATRMTLATFRRELEGREGFHGVMLDVPCSNTGVIRRHPDVRWNFSLTRLARLASPQFGLLEAAARCVRPGGRLVYSTCSLEPEENENRVEAWLRKHPEFRLVKARKLLPPRTKADGAYAARLERAAEG